MTLRPADRAYQLVNGFRAAQVVRAAVELDIPRLLSEEPRSPAELSVATGIPEERLRRLLRGLAGLGVLIEQEGPRYTNSEVGELFRDGVPGSRRALARMLLPESYQSWGHFAETLRSGVTGQQLAHGKGLWDSMRDDPDFGARFNEAMASNSENVARFIAASGDFSDAQVAVDVGGGKGALVTGILLARPGLRGVVFDVPAGLTETADYLAAHGLADRCSIVEGSFFESVPPGDVYVLKDILHDWDDEHAVSILRACRRSINPGGRLMIVERVVPSRVIDDPAHLHAVMADLQMMVQLGGRERTLEEYAPLFDAGGFASSGMIPGDHYHLVQARAV